jgi:hypothetical protein
MSEREEKPTVAELMLREPEIVAWLEDYQPPKYVERDEEEHEPSAAA